VRHDVEPGIVEDHSKLLQCHIGLGIIAPTTSRQKVVRPVTASLVKWMNMVYRPTANTTAVSTPTAIFRQTFSFHEIIHGLLRAEPHPT
jgi:hypothetical protein